MVDLIFDTYLKINHLIFKKQKTMKKFILSGIFCMLLFQVKGQTNNYHNRMQHIFGNIDKNKVNTGYLKEFGVRLNTIEDYDGVNDTLNFVDKTQWQSLYSSLYRVQYIKIKILYNKRR